MGHVSLQQLVALVSLLLVYGLSLAAENVSAPAGRVPKPTLEQGKGDKCVEDTDFMRKNHMKLLLHQRDETVHKGIRTKKYSLQNCIECHASQKTNSVTGSDQNFCQSREERGNGHLLQHPNIVEHADDQIAGFGFSVK